MTDTIQNNSDYIYGSNNDTSAFIRLAENEMKNGNYEKAIELLHYGIKKYPNYPTSYFLYGKSLLTLGKIKEAEEVFQTGIDIVGFKDTKEYYTSLIPEIKEEAVTEDVNETFPEEKNIVAENEVESEPLKTNDEEKEEPILTPHENDEVDLEELANKLSNAKMDMPRDHDAQVQPKKENEPVKPSSPRGLVSETLARIYESQENYKEAIEIYETLIEIQPEREDYFRRKLEEVKMKKGSK